MDVLAAGLVLALDLSVCAKTGLLARHPFLSHVRCPRALRFALGLVAETIGKETNRRSRILLCAVG